MKKNVKQLLSALLVIAMMATLLIVPAAAAGKTEVDVWDFGAEQLADTEQYQFNNQLTVEEINGWYSEETASAKQPTLASFTSETGIAFSDGGFPSTHRLRTTNDALTRYDSKSLKGDGNDPYIAGEAGEVVYTGYVYSNKGSDPNVYLRVALEAGDILTAIVSSNGGASTITFDGPNGVEATDEWALSSSGNAKTMTFYAKESGNYKLYSTTEKLVVARLYRQHATEVAVSGTVDEPADMPAGYSLVFTNTITGAETEATPTGGRYTVTLLAPYTYEVSLKGADTVAVETGKTVKVSADSATLIHDVKLKAIDMVTVHGTITGLDEKQLEKMGNDLLFTPAGPDVVYIPKTTVTAEGNSATYTVNVEKGRETNLSALWVNDSYISTEPTSGRTFEEDTELNITFAKKTTYAITIDPQGLTLADLADATFVFTNLDEGGETEDRSLTPYSDKNVYHYVYTFPGPDGIALRDGTYNVAVTTTAGTQRLTSNLVVSGAAATKTIKFTPASAYVAPGNHSFVGTEAKVVPVVDGMSFSGFVGHKADDTHGLTSTGSGPYTITLKLEDVSNVIIAGCQFSKKDNAGAVIPPTATADGADVEVVSDGATDPTYTISGVSGTLVITFPTGGASYVHGITVESAVKTYPTEWDFGTWAAASGGATTDPVPASVLNGIKATGNFKNHVSNYGIYVGTGSLEIPVSGPCTVTVTVGYGYDIKFPGDTAATTVAKDAPTTTFPYEYEGEEGFVKVEFGAGGSGATTYISKITVEYPEEVYYGTHWDFKNDDLGSQGTPYYPQNDATGIILADEDGVGAMHVYGGKFQYHGSNYGTTGNGYTMVVPVMTACTVKVKVGYSWSIWSPNYPGHTTAETADKKTADAGRDELTLKYDQDEPGEVTIYAVSGDTTYIEAVTVEYDSSVELPKPPVVEDIVFTVGKGEDKNFQTITDALNAAAAAKRDPGQRITIAIDPGNYEEQLYITTKDLTLKNANDEAQLKLTDKGVNIAEGEVRITHYYGHGYTYYSMTNGHRYSEDALEVNLENGYPSYENKGSGSTDKSYWNASVVIEADGFQAEGIIFENSFNQYVSEKAAADKLVRQGGGKEPQGGKSRVDMKDEGDTTVQDKAYVERAAALTIAGGDEIFFDHCAFVGRQDTLVLNKKGSRAAFYDCDVYGGTDYICGGMTAVFAKCDLVFNTSEDNNDVGYITAPQQNAGQRGYLMYNCTVTSTDPDKDNTASAKISKPGLFGRPWSKETGEAVFYCTNIEATDPSYFVEGDPTSTSLIAPEGWTDTLSDESALCGEYGTVEYYEGVDPSAKRVTWAAQFDEPETADHQSLEDCAAWLGGWDPFEDKVMTVETQKQEPCPIEKVTAVESVKVTPDTLTLKVGGTYEITADVTPVDANATVYWTTEDTNVITLSADKGEKVTVTAVAKGTATITAKAGDKTVDVAVTVEDKGQTPETTYNITITPVDGANITTEPDGKAAAGDEVTVTVTVTHDTKEVAEVTYKVENDTQTYQATKGDDGKYTFTMPEANVTVTATLKDKEGQGGDEPGEIAVKINTSKVTVKKTVKLSATVTPADAEYNHIYWVSDDTDILDVKADGTATGVKAGTAKVYAYVMKGEGNDITVEGDVLTEATKAITVSNASSGYGGGGSTTGQTTTPAKTTTTTNANGDTVKTETKTNGDKTITVTDKDGNVLAKVEIPAQTPDLGYKFTDVPDDHWAEPSIQAMAAMKIFQGVSTTGHIFDMNSAVTRGTMAQILFNLSQGKTGMTNSFADVAAGAWYTDAIAWAAAAGVVTGVSDTAFAPNDSITREQLVTMLYRYAKLLDLDVSAKGDLTAYVDGDAVDSWAADAMAWAVGAGLLQGKGNNDLDPTAAASRAEAAVIIDRFLMMVK